MSDNISAFIQQAPPVSRTLAGTAFLLSFASQALGLIHPRFLIYHAPLVWKLSRPELWRPLTSFFLTSPKLGIIMDTFFLFRYASDCERTKFTRPGDFLVFLIFCGSVIVALNSVFVGGMVFCQALILALAYYWTALEDSSKKVSFFIATFPVKFLPLVMLAMTFVQAGTGAALVEATGIVAAHLYLFLTDIYPRVGGGRNFIRTPNWIHALFDAPGDNASGPRPRAPTGPSARPVPTAPGTAASGRGIFAPSNSQWTHRGQGHRLGS